MVSGSPWLWWWEMGSLLGVHSLRSLYHRPTDCHPSHARAAYRLVEFSSADAWNMGNVLRSSALTLLSRRRDVTPPGLVFRIQLLSGLVLFQISVGRESSLRLMEMVEKKINVGQYVGSRLRLLSQALPQVSYA